ncbi:hypothetical protein AAFF_G00429550 [Aldrovandia affinis]|uniref:Uncharacterized protein n=1 Tax=Aldrovandia affinis TaxID=143900 RepID=A0AAD7VYF9_9TELE|nr:hypothetical protein AAFF_G00429550 [Aldrovandia affinis]
MLCHQKAEGQRIPMPYALPRLVLPRRPQATQHIHTPPTHLLELPRRPQTTQLRTSRTGKRPRAHRQWRSRTAAGAPPPLTLPHLTPAGTPEGETTWRPASLAYKALWSRASHAR